MFINSRLLALAISGGRFSNKLYKCSTKVRLQFLLVVLLLLLLVAVDSLGCGVCMEFSRLSVIRLTASISSSSLEIFRLALATPATSLLLDILK